ncbi:CapA family protein [Vreelandella alkaliphila]|uniref:CapA family protein n=1 Tax=Vreelandella alkaliphila TaxID=272774 RepID=A0A7C9K5M9_9GAMM|nr:CapA family protein [Halomonas alkaliphila]NDL70181.1 CapA family protein [Halomonas alkaliphila]
MTLQEIYKKYKENEEKIQKILQMLKKYIEENEEEVTATLQSVASGELEMPETISPEEEKHFRALCGWIVSIGLEQFLAIAQPVLNDPSILTRGITLDDIEGVMPEWLPPKEIVDAFKENGRALTRQAVLLTSYIFYDEFHYPQPETGIYDIADNPFQKLKWLYRYWLNQLEVAEQGSGLEGHFTKQKDLNYEDIQIEELPEQPIIPTATISCAGDLLAVDVLTPENSPHLFDEITDFYSTADIVSANLESTVDECRPIGRYNGEDGENAGQPAQMNTSKAMFDKFRREAKINYFSTATNHAMDWGVSGVNATLKVLKDSGAYYSGTTKSDASEGEERDGFTIIEKNGIRIAMLAYTFDLNGYEKYIPANMPYLVNVVRFNDADPTPDYSLIEKQVAAAKAKGAEHIIAYCHWGWEFEMYPHVNIREAAHKVIDCGVDTILGNHAHVSQPAELIPREGKQDALVIYAFGDFVSYHPESRNSKLAYIVKFDLIKFGGKVFRQHIKSLPIYIVNQHLGGKRYDCRIVKFEDVLKDPDGYGLTELEKRQLKHLNKKVWNDILSPLSGLDAR